MFNYRHLLDANLTMILFRYNVSNIPDSYLCENNDLFVCCTFAPLTKDAHGEYCCIAALKLTHLCYFMYRQSIFDCCWLESFFNEIKSNQFIFQFVCLVFKSIQNKSVYICINDVHYRICCTLYIHFAKVILTLSASFTSWAWSTLR